MMDGKALARSKRAHSSHHSKRRHLPSNPSHPTPIPLRSNWDRYEDHEEDNAPDTVLPKTKGADYQYLLEESRSNAVPSFDDELLDAFTGSIAERMLTIKGDRITTWIDNDNFLVDGDSHSSTFKLPLLSLNLRTLADQLEKVDLSRRLYIESDFSSFETDPTVQKQSEDNEADILTYLADAREKLDQPNFRKIKSTEEENSPSTKRNVADASAVGLELDELTKSFEEINTTSSFRNKFAMKEKDVKTKDSTDSCCSYTGGSIESKYGSVDASSSQNLETELDTLLSSSKDGTFNTLEAEVDTLLSSSKGGTFNTLEAKVDTLLSSSKGGTFNTLEAEVDTLEDSELGINFGKQREKQKMKAESEQVSLSSYDKSKLIDDFDSWMDSL